jgi:hypothetical protein
MVIYTTKPTNPTRFCCPICMDEVKTKCLPCECRKGEIQEYYPVCGTCGCEDLQEIIEEDE